MAEFRLETERLVLRDWRDGDADAFFRDTNTPAVMRWLGGVMDDGKMAAQLQRIRLCRSEHGHCFWIVERKQDREVLGFCGIKRSNQAGGPIGEFEIGWRLREDAWGQGFAREAAVASLAAAFERFAAPHVIAFTVEGNTGSWGLMRRLGMIRRPDLDFTNDDFGVGPTIVHSITAAQWAEAGTAHS